MYSLQSLTHIHYDRAVYNNFNTQKLGDFYIGKSNSYHLMAEVVQLKYCDYLAYGDDSDGMGLFVPLVK